MSRREKSFVGRRTASAYVPSNQRLCYSHTENFNIYTVVPTKSDSVVILCLQLLSKTTTCKLHLS